MQCEIKRMFKIIDLEDLGMLNGICKNRKKNNE